MFKIKHIIILLFILPLHLLFSQQKQTEQIIVPLSKPNQPGSLFVHNLNGLIRVTGYTGYNVIIEATLDNKMESSGKSGLKIIAKKSMKLDATEKDNNISFSTNNYDDRIDLDIKAPYSFSLNLSIMDEGSIEVRNISGEFVLNCTNGNILLSNVTGSAVVSTIDGDITAQFDRVNSDLPMKFNTVSGKIDLTFPAQLKATFDMNSEFGDILTDINLDIDKSKTQVQESNKNGLKRYSLDSSTMGKMNGGGQRITIRALDGNIYIRKGK